MPAERDARASDLQLSASAEWSSARGTTQVTWIVRLTNRTDTTLRVVHPSGRYAAVVLRRMGRVVYSTRGGEFHAFWSWTLPPRATFVCSLTPDALDPDGLPTGRYDISANLNLFPFGVQAHHPLSIVTG
jgi:hypothetical protein